MSATATFRAQHAEFLDIIAAIRPSLDPARLATDLKQVRTSLLTLLGKFAVHLAVEDEALYPRCQTHRDPQVRKVAQTFAIEMSNTKPTVDAFARKWTEVRMRSSAAEFCSEARALFGVLEARIHRENDEFYALVDRAV